MRNYIHLLMPHKQKVGERANLDYFDPLGSINRTAVLGDAGGAEGRGILKCLPVPMSPALLCQMY